MCRWRMFSLDEWWWTSCTLMISFFLQMLDSHSLFCYSMKGYYRGDLLYSPKIAFIMKYLETVGFQINGGIVAMKGFLTVLFVLIGIVFMINFPITVIGMAIAIWGLYALQKNKKLNVKSKMAPVLLLLAVSISLVGCAPTPEDDEVEKAVTTEEIKDKTSEQTVADEKAEEVVTIEEEEK